MDGLRWEDYALASGAEEVSKIWSAALELERRVTFVLGVGFDPRALVALKSLLTQVRNQVLTVRPFLRRFGKNGQKLRIHL